MKKLLAISFGLVLLLCFNSANAQEYRSALGIRLSSSPAVVNNSVSFKYFTSETVALEALLTFSDPVAIGLLIENTVLSAPRDCNGFMVPVVMLVLVEIQMWVEWVL